MMFSNHGVHVGLVSATRLNPLHQICYEKMDIKSTKRMKGRGRTRENLVQKIRKKRGVRWRKGMQGIEPVMPWFTQML